MNSPTPRRSVAAAGTLAALALVLAPTLATAAPGRPGEPRFSAGADGVGDTYFPQAGNGGIDVRHYDLDLRYAPNPAPPEGEPYTAGHLDATATITLTATQDLHSFNLDLLGLDVERVTVNGKRASFSRDGRELTISPRPKLFTGRTATVVIDYSGAPAVVDSPIGQVGWIPTDDGALALTEPDAAATWFPVNDHPTDKASYTFDVTVPEGLAAIANGLPTGNATAGGWTTWSWDAPDVMASYLATVTIGRFEITDRVTDAGIRVVDAIDPDIPADMRAALDATDAQLAFFTDLFGFYPYVAYGSIVDDYYAGLALETNTRPVYAGFVSDYVTAHEMAHQWTGNLVSPADWHDIWLNEGWATYLGFYWQEYAYGIPAGEQMRYVYDVLEADDPYWAPVIADPGVPEMFGFAVYYKGAMAIDQLRTAVGEDAFRVIAREWVTRYEDGTATTEQFQALCEEISGQDLDALFAEWVYSAGKPAEY